MNKKWFALILLAALAAALPLRAQEVPFELQMKLIMKILEFDKNFDRFGDPIKIGVTSDDVLTALNAQKNALQVKGKSFIAEKMATPADIAKYHVIYVDKNWSAEYKTAAAKAGDNKALMFTRDEEGVMNGGGAISFKTIEGKPKIMLSIANARTQGSDFPANFLQLTVVIGGL
jgi:hypothetical protein